MDSNCGEVIERLGDIMSIETPFQSCEETREEQRLVCVEGKILSCVEKRVEEYEACDEWAKKYECCDWWPCSTICSVLVWFGKWLCKAWRTITYTFCILYAWITVFFCYIQTWVIYTICVFLAVVTCFPSMFSANEQSFDMEECIYGWNAAYRIEGNNCNIEITVKIRLNPDSGISNTDLNDRMQVWETAIESTWSNQFQIERSDGECSCETYSVSFNVEFVESNEHHTVRVRNGAGTANMGNWYITSSGRTASHEFGHMLGFIDEYAATECPDRNVTSDNSIMQDNREGPRERHYEPFADWISDRTCCEYEVA